MTPSLISLQNEDVISLGNRWWLSEMLAVLSGYLSLKMA